MTDDHPAATDLLERALAIYRDLGDRSGRAGALHKLGRVCEAEALHSTGASLAEPAAPQQALALYRQALQLARQANTPLNEARALEGTAHCTARIGDREAALSDLSEAIAIYQRIGAAEAGPVTAYLATLEEDDRDKKAALSHDKVKATN